VVADRVRVVVLKAGPGEGSRVRAVKIGAVGTRAASAGKTLCRHIVQGDATGTIMRAEQQTRRTGGRLLLRLVQVAKYFFLILLSGLVGAYAGTFVDALMQNASGMARHWGWILGAVVAAIGAPFGWVSFGSDGKSRRSIFALPMQRIRTSSKGARSGITAGRERPMGAFKAAAAGGFLGLLAGGALGGTLLMVWFSIAMSPFAPTAWNRSVSLKKERPAYIHRDRERANLSTKNPIPLTLFFGSVAVLGTAGAIAGAIFGLAGKATEAIEPSAESATSQSKSDIK